MTTDSDARRAPWLVTLALPHELLANEALLVETDLFGVTGARLWGLRMARVPPPPLLAWAWGRSWQPAADTPPAT
jgi:hypothetical protein